jgi:hypothetical protein
VIARAARRPSAPSPRRARRPARWRLRRTAAALASAFAAFAGSLLAAGSAAAASGGPAGTANLNVHTGSWGMPWPEAVLVFAGIPIGAGLVIAFLVYLPSMVRGPRYRPGRPWTAGSVWLGGPADPDAALATVTSPPDTTTHGGGASARW